MTQEERTEYQSKHYNEAIRYMDNAEDDLKKAGKRGDGVYKDEKYVRVACGTAYLGVLEALDAWLTLKGVEVPKRHKHANINFYLTNVGKLDLKLLSHLNSVYNVLHCDGYYRKETSVKIINDGFDEAYYIIGKIKPAEPKTSAPKKRTANARAR